ncbi:MAG: ribosome silencing factor [Acidobacteriota bacterium]|nr:MAG: ribosome silencing factor [Acidobacteriota bacterium]
MKERNTIKKVYESIEEKKGDAVLILDISRISSFADFFILCQGYNQRQNQAICDEIRERLKKEDNLSPSHVEGYETAEWILLDYLSFVVHIFSPEAREFYKIERLWNDGEAVAPEALSA